MALRKILVCGDPVLRMKAKRVRSIDDGRLEMREDMVETMFDAPGIGLAAPQIGESVRVVVVADLSVDDDQERPEVHRLINPRIVEAEGQVEAAEGCLSLPTLQGVVLRPRRVVVEALDADGEPMVMEMEGWSARAISHEIDHLDGRMFIDLAEPDSLAWMVPDEEDDRGYRLNTVSKQEALEAFQRLVDRAKADG